jgi:hypothetical protein
MRSHLALPLALAIAIVAVSLSVVRFVYAPSGPLVAHASLPSRPGSYLGVYEAGAPPAFAPIAQFALAAHQPPNVAGYYSGWAERFDTPFADLLSKHGIIPFVQIDPTDASVSAIAAGYYDIYLRSFATSVKDFRRAVIIGFGHEMNAPWYAWGYGHVPPATFIAAWRHIVQLFRSVGADNVTWLWTINADLPGTGQVHDWWPGAAYVTWVGIDGYYYGPADTFVSVFGRTLAQVRAFTGAPVLLSETAVGPRAGQLAKIGDLFAGMRKARLLGLVWYDIDQAGGVLHQDWRIEGSAPAQAAFRLGAAQMSLFRP